MKIVEMTKEKYVFDVERGPEDETLRSLFEANRLGLEGIAIKNVKYEDKFITLEGRFTFELETK